MTQHALMTKEQAHELEDLLTRIIDSAKGYKECCDEAESPRFEELFKKRARQRDTFASEIRSCLAESGADFDADGSLLAGMHRMFVEIRTKLGGSDEAVFKEIVRGETALVEAYEEALECTPSNSKVYSILTRQLSTVRADLQDAKQKAKLLD